MKAHTFWVIEGSDSLKDELPFEKTVLDNLNKIDEIGAIGFMKTLL